MVAKQKLEKNLQLVAYFIFLNFLENKKLVAHVQFLAQCYFRTQQAFQFAFTSSLQLCFGHVKQRDTDYHLSNAGRFAALNVDILRRLRS